MTTIPRSRVQHALLTGLMTTAYYAVPDVARTRASRGWLKAACAAAAFAAALPGARDGWHELRRSWHEAVDEAAVDEATVDGPSDEVTTRPDAPPPAGHVAAVVGLVTVVGSLAGTVAFERWVFRRGQARAAAGVPFAHTRAALVIGALTTVAELVVPAATRSDDRPEDSRTD